MITLKRLHFLMLMALLMSGCGSACGGGNPGSNGNSNRDAGPDADAVPSDAGRTDAEPDATGDGGRPEGVAYDYCHQDLFKLPPGPTEDILSVFLRDHYVVSSRWVDYPERDTLHDVYLFDLQECKEYALIKAPDVQAGDSIYGTEVVVGDYSYEGSRGDLFIYDIESWSYIRLTDSSESEAHAKYNGRHVAYWDSTGAPDGGNYGLTLWELQTDEHITLSTWQAAPEVHAISERYVAWTARCFDPPGYGKDVFYHDLQTGVTTHIESTGQFDIRVLDLSGDRIVWMENDNDHYNIILYKIETEDEVRLTGDGFDHRNPRIRGNLVAWITYMYSGGSYATDPAHEDLYLYDLDTGVGRRITSESAAWAPGHAHPPWLLFKKMLGQWNREVYVMNMVQSGVIDSTGHVIPE